MAVLTPERESSPETLSLSKFAAESLGIEWVLEDITPILEASGCYSRRDAAISELLPAYGAGWRLKLILPSVLENTATDSLHSWPSHRQVSARSSASLPRPIGKSWLQQASSSGRGKWWSTTTLT